MRRRKTCLRAAFLCLKRLTNGLKYAILLGYRILGCRQAVRQRTLTPSPRGFESRQPSHERNLFCLPRQERFFHAFRSKIALNIGKYRQNRGWNGHEGRTSPCFWLFGGEMIVLLFAFLYRAKKLAKQHPTGFEYGKPQRCRGKVTAKPCKLTGFVL